MIPLSQSNFKWYLLKYLTLFAQFIARIGYDTNFKKGDFVLCLGYGYPHWQNQCFVVTDIFPNGDLGLHNHVKVNSKDFVILKKAK